MIQTLKDLHSGALSVREFLDFVWFWLFEEEIYVKTTDLYFGNRT